MATSFKEMEMRKVKIILELHEDLCQDFDAVYTEIEGNVTEKST